MKTSFKAVRAALVAVFVFMVGYAVEAQRIKLLQLERYLGKPIPGRAGYVGLTDTLGDQYYHKLDSIIAHIADSIAEATDTDEQYFDSIAIVNDTLHFSLIRDGLPLHKISLKYLIDHDWYEVGSTSPPTNITQYKYSMGRITVGENAVYDQAFAVPLSDIRVRQILIGYGGGALNSNMRAGIDALSSNTVGIENMAIGLNALKLSDADGNTAVGPYTLASNTTGIYNTAIGTSSSRYNVDGDFNTTIGYLSGFSNVTGSNNTNIGLYTGLSNTTGMGNTNIGAGAGSDANSVSNNVNIGYQAGHENLTGENNTIIGTMAGMTGAGSGKVLIGFNAGLTDTLDNVLYIDNSNTTAPLIFGDFANDTVRVNGSLQVTNRLGTADTIAGWRNSDNKAVNIGLGDGLHLTSGVLSSRDSQYLDVINITDDTLNISIVRDGVTTHRLDLKPYLDSDPENTDIQYFDTLYFSMDTLYLSIIRDDLPVHKIYLGDLVSVSDQDKQQHDSAFILNDTLYLSLQRDSVSAHEIDLTPYLDDTDDQYIDTATIELNVLRLSLHDDNLPFLAIDLSPYVAQAYLHTGTTSYTNTLTLGGGSFTLSPLSGISIVHNGSGIVTFQNTGIISFDINSVDDAYSATTIQNGNTINFDGINGITTTLASPGSTTVQIDGSALIDHDWYEVGTTSPPNSITDEMFHTGKTGIGMNPVYLLDVAEDARIYGHEIGRGGGNSLTNIRFGDDALSSNTTGSNNVAIGANTLDANVSGSHNMAIGANALAANTSDNNIAIGEHSMYLNTSGNLNVAVGGYALYSSQSAYDNTAIGHAAMFAATTAAYNTALGHSALSFNKTGTDNTALGDYALREDSLAEKNVSIGRYSMQNTSLSLGNVAVGYQSFQQQANAASQYNTAIGYRSMVGHATATQNTYNVGIGYQALSSITGSSDENIAIGKNAGLSLSGNNNTILGNDNTVTGNVDNNVIIGDGQTVTSAGNIVITNGAGVLGLKMLSTGLVGIGEATPTQKLHVAGSARITGAVYDSNNDPGTSGQVLSSTVTGTDWITVAGGTGTDLAWIDAGSQVALTSSSGNDVNIVEGSGITLSASGVNMTITAVDNSATNEIQSLGWLGSGTIELTISGASGIYIAPGTGISLSQVGSTMTITNTGDVSISNEGSLSVGAGSGTTSLINSNTSGSSSVTLSAGTGITLSEVGNTITIASTNTGTVTSVGVVVPTGLGVTPASITTSGTFTFSLNNDLQALENFTTQTGIAVRTAASTWAMRTITSALGTVAITNPGGVLGNINLEVANTNLTFSGGSSPMTLNSSTGTDVTFTAGSNVTLTGSSSNITIGMNTVTAIATGFTNGTFIITDGSGTFGEAGGISYSAAGGGTILAGGATISGTLNAGGTNLIAGTSGIYMSSLPTFDSDAAAGSLSSGRVYKSSTGELRIKL